MDLNVFLALHYFGFLVLQLGLLIFLDALIDVVSFGLESQLFVFRARHAGLTHALQNLLHLVVTVLDLLLTGSVCLFAGPHFFLD